jgi:hypothetical protein
MMSPSSLISKIPRALRRTGCDHLNPGGARAVASGCTSSPPRHSLEGRQPSPLAGHSPFYRRRGCTGQSATGETLSGSCRGAAVFTGRASQPFASWGVGTSSRGRSASDFSVPRSVDASPLVTSRELDGDRRSIHRAPTLHLPGETRNRRGRSRVGDPANTALRRRRPRRRNTRYTIRSATAPAIA